LRSNGMGDSVLQVVDECDDMLPLLTLGEGVLWFERTSVHSQ
jgi:hypothetical protein